MEKYRKRKHPLESRVYKRGSMKAFKKAKYKNIKLFFTGMPVPAETIPSLGPEVFSHQSSFIFAIYQRPTAWSVPEFAASWFTSREYAPIQLKLVSLDSNRFCSKSKFLFTLFFIETCISYKLFDSYSMRDSHWQWVVVEERFHWIRGSTHIGKNTHQW